MIIIYVIGNDGGVHNFTKIKKYRRFEIVKIFFSVISF